MPEKSWAWISESDASDVMTMRSGGDKTRVTTLYLRRERSCRGTAAHAVCDDATVILSSGPTAIVEAVQTFFAEQRLASLRLPSGWFGRPNGNLLQLTETSADGPRVLVRLDDRHVLTLDAEDVWADGKGVLGIQVGGGLWHWVEYGSDVAHDEVLGPGMVEFHAQFGP
jgi:hypothetical protein